MAETLTLTTWDDWVAAAGSVSRLAQYAQGDTQVDHPRVEAAEALAIEEAATYLRKRYGAAADALIGLQNNPDIHEWYGSANGVKNIDTTMLSQFFQIPEVFVWGYSRVFDGQTTPTEFWPANALLVFSKQASPDLDDSSLGFTAVSPYGAAFGRAGVLTDVRIDGPKGVEMLTEVAACQRWHEVLANPTLGFLSTGVTGF